MSDKTLFDSLNTTGKPEQRVVCQHYSKLGNQCKREAVEGEQYCVIHGASKTATTEASQRKLLSLQSKSLAVLEDMLESFDEKARLAASLAILDRTGLGPKSTVVHEEESDLSKLSGEELANELRDLEKRAREEVNRQRMNEAMNKKPIADGVTH